MRVVLSTVSRFHTFDLARELGRAGVLECVFTGQPRWNLRREGVPLDRVSTFPYLQVPWEAAHRMGLDRFPGRDALNWYCHQALDRYVADRLPPVDIFHALSYCGLRSGLAAQARGAAWICDSPMSHWPYQEAMLRDAFQRLDIPYRAPPERFLEYARESYRYADLITVPSHSTARTFYAEGVSPERVAVVPYGVDLRRFSPVPVAPHRQFRALFVGQLGVRKGLDTLLSAFQSAAIPGAELRLVGPILPDGRAILARYRASDLVVLGPVAQRALPEQYSAADVLVLPSRCEGLALVIGQALGCGCPVIATEPTGARELITDGREGFVGPADSPGWLAERLTWLHEHPAERLAMRAAARQQVGALGGWKTYGDRMLELFHAVHVKSK